MSALRMVMRRAVIARPGAVRGGGGRPMPPHVRLPPPASSLNEHHELVWNDSVAPEVCVDTDAPNVSPQKATQWWFTAIASLGALYMALSIYDPKRNRPVACRTTTMGNSAFFPPDVLQGRIKDPAVVEAEAAASSGGGSGAGAAEEEDEEEEEEEED